MNLSEVLKKRRSELGYTLLFIANKMGVSEATVQRWESGNIKSLRQGRIAQLAEILRVSPSTLMGWDEPDNDIQWEDVPIDALSGKIVSDRERPYFDNMVRLIMTQSNDKIFKCYLTEEQKDILISMISSWGVEEFKDEEVNENV